MNDVLAEEQPVPDFIKQEKKRSVASMAGALATGNILSAVLRMAGGILTARAVEPAVLGLFNGMGLVLGYAPFLQLGILNGLNRELPYYIGKRDYERVRELASAAQMWALLIGSIAALCLFAVSGWELLQGHLELAAGWATYAISVFILFFAQYYLPMTYRTGGDFHSLAKINVIQNGAALLLVALVWAFHFYGLCVRTLIVGIINLALHWYWRPVRVGLTWNKTHLKHLFKIGAPIFAVGQLAAWWIVLDSTLVFRLKGTHDMGLYSLVVIASSTFGLVPAAVSQVLYPRMAEHYGRNESTKDLIQMAIKPTLYLVAGMICAAAIGWMFVSSVVYLLLPKYVAAIPAVRWSLVAACISALGPVNNVFNVVRKQGFYATAIALGIASYSGALMWLMKQDNSLVVFPKAMIVGQVVFMLACYTFLWLRVYLPARGDCN